MAIHGRIPYAAECKEARANDRYEGLVLDKGVHDRLLEKSGNRETKSWP